MATVSKILTYDLVKDKDIDDWINSIKKRERSKYIRIAIRAYLNTENRVTVPTEPDYIDPPNRERISFSYDDEEDNDIHIWFDTLSKRRHSEYIKASIRTYKHVKEGTNHAIFTNRGSLIQSQKNTPNDDEKSIVSESNQPPQKEMKQSDDDILGLDINFLDDLGK